MVSLSPKIHFSGDASDFFSGFNLPKKNLITNHTFRGFIAYHIMLLRSRCWINTLTRQTTGLFILTRINTPVILFSISTKSPMSSVDPNPVDFNLIVYHSFPFLLAQRRHHRILFYTKPFQFSIVGYPVFIPASEM